jgi:tetratricopeptide (TPR) repeat protein
LTGWQEGIDRELDNINIAWWWAIKNEQPQRLLPAGLAFFQYLDTRGNLREGARMFDALSECAANVQAGEQAKDALLRRAQAIALTAQSYLGMYTGQIADLLKPLKEAISLLEGLEAPDERALTLAFLGFAASLTKDRDGGQYLEEALILAQQEGHIWVQALVRHFLGIFHVTERTAKAKNDFESAIALWREHPGLTYCQARSMTMLSLALHTLGDPKKAQVVEEEALRLMREVRDVGFVPLSLNNLAFHRYAQGDLALARSDFASALIKAQQLNHFGFIWHSILGLGLVAAGEGRTSQAVTLLTSEAAGTESAVMFLLGEPQRVLDGLRAQLSPAEFAAAEARAQEMNLDDLIRLALSEGDR